MKPEEIHQQIATNLMLHVDQPYSGDWEKCLYQAAIRMIGGTKPQKSYADKYLLSKGNSNA